MEDQKKTKLLSTSSDFCKTTTAHGWGRFIRASNVIVRGLWLALTLVMLTACALQMSRLIMQYLERNTEIKMHIRSSPIVYPSVTVCNIMPISHTNAEALINNSSTEFFRWYNLTKHLDDFSDMAAQINKTQEFEVIKNRLQQPLGYFENIGQEVILAGHNPVDFLLACTFGIRFCEFTNFTYFQSPTYYNCYTFNSGNLTSNNLLVRTSGPQEGLSLIMYLESDNGDSLHNGTYHTLSYVGNAAGVRVVVHPPTSRPSELDHGFDIPPGYTASIGLEAKSYEREGEPYGECMEDIMSGSQRYRYTSHTCLQTCQQHYIMQECKCVSASLPIPEEDISDMKYCGFWNVSTSEDLNLFFSNISCEGNKLMEFAYNETLKYNCNCYPSCQEYGYEGDASLSYWPHDVSQENFYDIYVLNNPKAEKLKAYKNLQHLNVSDIIQYGLIRKNFIRLNVFFRKLTVEEHVEKESYELSRLFSDIGGTFGLCIGMSIISWCEMIELFVTLCYICCRRKPSTQSTNEEIEHTTNQSFAVAESAV